MEGITKITDTDFKYAEVLGAEIKLLAQGKMVDGNFYAMVAPKMIREENPLYSVRGVFNSILVKGNTLGEVMFYGSGAGKLPTASAVVADIADAALNIASDCCQRIPNFSEAPQFERLLPIEESVSRFYLRLQVKDTPGVMASITQILADRGINISSLIQHESQSGKANSVSLVILTHPVMERSMRAALSELGVLSINSSPVKLLRIEDI